MFPIVYLQERVHLPSALTAAFLALALRKYRNIETTMRPRSP